MTEQEIHDFMEKHDFVCRAKFPMKGGHFEHQFAYQNSDERFHGALEIPTYFVSVKDDGSFKCSYTVGFTGTFLETGWASPITNDKLRTRILKRFEEQIAVLHHHCE